MADLIVERCRLVREELLRQYGGLEGLFSKLEAMDREREESRRAHRRRPGRAGKNPPPKGRVAKKA